MNVIKSEETNHHKTCSSSNGGGESMTDISDGDDNNNEEEQEFTIRLPYFTVSQFESGQIGEFDEIIDVRTPLEFAEDRIPGSVNWPVLSNQERAEVGSLYAKDKMAGRRLGAALISRNISQHIINHLTDKPGYLSQHFLLF